MSRVSLERLHRGLFIRNSPELYRATLTLWPNLFCSTADFFLVRDMLLACLALRMIDSIILSIFCFVLFCFLHAADFAGGKAHHGISQSALRVWRTVQAQVEKQLREHSDYKLVLTGVCVYYGVCGDSVLTCFCPFRKGGTLE